MHPLSPRELRQGRGRPDRDGTRCRLTRGAPGAGAARPRCCPRAALGAAGPRTRAGAGAVSERSGRPARGGARRKLTWSMLQLSTFGVSLLGCLIGLLVALPLGYLLAHSRTASAALSPYLAASQAIPAVALAPLLVLWFGYGSLPKALLCALLVFFPILLNTVLGLTDGRPRHHRTPPASTVPGSGRLLVSIEGPMALPSVITGRSKRLRALGDRRRRRRVRHGRHGLGQLLAVFRHRLDTQAWSRPSWSWHPRGRHQSGRTRPRKDGPMVVTTRRQVCSRSARRRESGCWRRDATTRARARRTPA